MRYAATTAKPNVTLERAFAFAGLVAAFGTVSGGYLTTHGFGWQGMVVTTLVALLACALAGMWAEDMVVQHHRGEVARVYAQALKGGRDRGLERSVSEPTRMESLALSFADLIDNARKAMFYRDDAARWSTEMRRAIETRMKQSETLSARLNVDAHMIAEAAADSSRAEREIAAQIDQVRGHAKVAAGATAALAGEVDELAKAVRSVTTQTEKATAIATRLAETAFGAQRGVAGITEATAGMLQAADQVHAVLHKAEMMAMNAGIEAAHAGDAGRGFAVVAAEVKNLAQAGNAALDAMLNTVRELKTQTNQAFKHVHDMSDVVQAQHEFGHALSHASMLQADAVGRMVQQMNAAQGEMRGLQTQMQEFPQPGTRLGAGVAAQQAVERLPGYADAMAQILRGLPDLGKQNLPAWDEADPMPKR